MSINGDAREIVHEIYDHLLKSFVTPKKRVNPVSLLVAGHTLFS